MFMITLKESHNGLRPGWIPLPGGHFTAPVSNIRHREVEREYRYPRDGKNVSSICGNIKAERHTSGGVTS